MLQSSRAWVYLLNQELCKVLQHVMGLLWHVAGWLVVQDSLRDMLVENPSKDLKVHMEPSGNVVIPDASLHTLSSASALKEVRHPSSRTMLKTC